MFVGGLVLFPMVAPCVLLICVWALCAHFFVGIAWALQYSLKWGSVLLHHIFAPRYVFSFSFVWALCFRYLVRTNFSVIQIACVLQWFLFVFVAPRRFVGVCWSLLPCRNMFLWFCSSFWFPMHVPRQVLSNCVFLWMYRLVFTNVGLTEIASGWFAQSLHGHCAHASLCLLIWACGAVGAASVS